MVRKGNLTVFESSNISETRMATPIKIGVHKINYIVYSNNPPCCWPLSFPFNNYFNL